jgi:hypothetical protein
MSRQQFGATQCDDEPVATPMQGNMMMSQLGNAGVEQCNLATS